ncbi:slightly ste11-like protein [Dimargaris cristalligena]|nr:slightly ste11-like protein [Dimargaris cristalligena]
MASHHPNHYHNSHPEATRSYDDFTSNPYPETPQIEQLSHQLPQPGAHGHNNVGAHSSAPSMNSFMPTSYMMPPSQPSLPVTGIENMPYHQPAFTPAYHGYYEQMPPDSVPFQSNPMGMEHPGQHYGMPGQGNFYQLPQALSTVGPMKSKARAKEEKIGRPHNSFMLYRKDMQKLVIKDNPNMNQKIVSKKVGEMWKNAPESVKEHYGRLAEQAKEEHKKKYPNYKYNPRRTDKHAKKRERMDLALATGGQYEPMFGVPHSGAYMSSLPHQSGMMGSSPYPVGGSYPVPDYGRGSPFGVRSGYHRSQSLAPPPMSGSLSPTATGSMDGGPRPRRSSANDMLGDLLHRLPERPDGLLAARDQPFGFEYPSHRSSLASVPVNEFFSVPAGSSHLPPPSTSSNSASSANAYDGSMPAKEATNANGYRHFLSEWEQSTLVSDMSDSKSFESNSHHSPSSGLDGRGQQQRIQTMATLPSDVQDFVLSSNQGMANGYESQSIGDRALDMACSLPQPTADSSNPYANHQAFASPDPYSVSQYANSGYGNVSSGI